jgi:hypothetical protein
MRWLVRAASPPLGLPQNLVQVTTQHFSGKYGPSHYRLNVHNLLGNNFKTKLRKAQNIYFSNIWRRVC